MKLRALDVSYGQIAVFQSALQQPFNDWTDAHVAQGFAWRPGSVSFATLETAGPIDIEMARTSSPPSADNSPASRIIVVPFSAGETGDVEIATIGDGEALSLPPGEYRLTFEHGLNSDGTMWCRFSFEQTATAVSSEVVRADAALAPSVPLVMHAVPAQ